MKSRISDANDPIMSIGTVAEKLGISISTIRKYESEGIIIPYRTGSGHRFFSLEDLDRIRMIQKMIRKQGLNIEGIRRLQALLPCWDILKCNKATRINCPAFVENAKPCWMVICSKSAGKKMERCRQCIVYRFGSQSTEEIKSLIYNDSKSMDVKEKLVHNFIEKE